MTSPPKSRKPAAYRLDDPNVRVTEMKTLAHATPTQPKPLLADVKWDEVRTLCR